MRWLDSIINFIDINLSKLWGAVNERQGILICWSPWDRKELDMTLFSFSHSIVSEKHQCGEFFRADVLHYLSHKFPEQKRVRTHINEKKKRRVKRLQYMSIFDTISNKLTPKMSFWNKRWILNSDCIFIDIKKLTLYFEKSINFDFVFKIITFSWENNSNI